MILVDSSVWIDWFRGSPTEQTVWLEGQIGRARLGIADLVLMEVLRGLRTERDFTRVYAELTRTCTTFDTGGQKLAVAAARNDRLLRTKRFTVRKPVDALIATFCTIAEFSLLHRDRDFDAFEKHLGLRVIHPVRH